MNAFPGRDLPPGRHRLLREHLLTEIRQSEKSTEKAPAPKKKSTIWFRPALLAGAVAATVAAGVLVASPFGDRAAQAEPPSKETVRVLRQIAAAAKAQPAPRGIRDDQFVYVKTKERYMETGSDETSRLQPLHVREAWDSVDGRHTGLVDDRVDHLDNERVPPELPLSEGDSHYRSLEKLPTDPVNMRDWLYRVASGEESTDQNAFVQVGDLCGGLMPPKQAAALYLAAAKIPGVEVRPDAVDAAGRHGVAITRENDGEREELIFEKETKQFLGRRQVATEDLPTGFKKGTVTGHSAVLKRVVVDKAGQRS